MIEDKTIETVEKSIEKINKEYGITIVMVSHDLLSAVNYATHILHLNKTESYFGLTQDYIQSNIYKKFSGGNNYD